MPMTLRLVLATIGLCACAPTTAATDAFSTDAAAPIDTSFSLDASPAADAFAAADVASTDSGASDANDACVVDYNVGHCISTASCSAMSGYSSTAHLCPGPANIECCALTPDLSTNPPFPTGYRLMMQSEVTAPMTTWAVAILHDGATYPMFTSTLMTFPTQPMPVLARVLWHPPDFQNSVVHRGVTLFVHT